MRSFPFGQSLVLVNPSLNSLVILNATARLAWELLEAGCDSEEVANAIASHFAIPPEAVGKDIADIIALWRTGDFSGLSDLTPHPANMPPLDQDKQPASDQVYLLSYVPFLIRSHSVEVTAILKRVLGHLEAPASTAANHMFEVLAEGSCYRLLLDDVEIKRTASSHELRHALLYEIAKISYPAWNWLIFLHAGAVSIGERCIVMPGLPFCGKSTLTAALIHQGFDYVTEDIVPISCELRVAPVPARLCLREGGWQAFRREFPSVQALAGGSRWGQKLHYITPPLIRERSPRKLSVHSLIFPEYKTGQACELTPISSEEALALMIQTGAWFGKEVNETKVETLLGWIQETPKYHLCYDDFKSVASSIRNLFRK